MRLRSNAITRRFPLAIPIWPIRRHSFFSPLAVTSLRRGLRIQIDKQIPVAAGLGGGSSNAAAVLMGMNAHYGFPLSPHQLFDLGLSLGADVPFFLYGKPALATGIGERLEAFDALPNYHVVVIFPGFAVSTATVFSQLNLRLTNREKKPTKALLKNKGFIAPNHLHNDLESVALKVLPGNRKSQAKTCGTGCAGGSHVRQRPFGFWACLTRSSRLSRPRLP